MVSLAPAPDRCTDEFIEGGRGDAGVSSIVSAPFGVRVVEFTIGER